MDFDDLEGPSQVPSRVSRFAPKSSKLKPKPKLEPQQSAPNNENAQVSFSKPEPQEFNLTAEKKENGEETVGAPATAATTAKVEPLAPNGTARMDVEPKSETEDESKQDDPMEEDTAEDTVVREIDVFFKPSIDADTQLYVLQYPLRPFWRPYELDKGCEEVRLKPESSEVEVDLSIDFESNNIDKEFASRLKMTKQTLSTSWKPLRANRYAVGILMEDKLHLHPIHAVVQLRPSLKHLNSGSSKRKNVVSTGANPSVKIEGSIEETSAAPSKKQCWVPLKYHSCQSDISFKYLEQMVAQESSPINFTMSAYDYLNTLCPGVSSNISPKVPFKRYLLSLPLEERLKKLLIEGPPLHRFNTIKHFAPECTEEELLGFLQQHAILVRGLWIPKSELLYPQGGVENLARDYALTLFSKNLIVKYSDLNVRGDLGNHVKNFLKIFGLERYEKNKSSAQEIPYWKFKELPDDSFKKLHPNIVEKQEEVLKGLEQRVSAFVYNVGKLKTGKNVVANQGVKSELVKSANLDRRTASLGGVPPGRMTMSNDTRQALQISLKKLFQNHKVCSFQMICQGLRDMAVSQSMPAKTDKVLVDAALSVDGPQEELKAVINEVAYNIHGSYVLKSSQDDQFRDVVIDLLRGSGPNAKLKKAEISEATQRKLGRELNNNEYTKVMNELCVSKGSCWILKAGDQSKH